MKILIKILVVAMVLSLSVYAQENHQQDEDTEGKPMGGMMMKMMDDNEKTAMHEKMQSMQAMMQKIKQESDPDKRQVLMQEHMVSMQKMMDMMKDNKSDNMSSKKDMNKKGMKNMDMEKRMEMMEEHMGMMKMMMEQMMNHNNEASHTHK